MPEWLGRQIGISVRKQYPLNHCFVIGKGVANTLVPGRHTRNGQG